MSIEILFPALIFIVFIITKFYLTNIQLRTHYYRRYFIRIRKGKQIIIHEIKIPVAFSLNIWNRNIYSSSQAIYL